MNYTIKKLPKSQIEISASLSKEEYDIVSQAALADFAAEIEIEGFRKGRAPLNLVRECVGQERLHTSAAQKAIQKYYEEIAVKEKLQVIGRPNVEVKTSEPDFSFITKIAVLPEVKLPDYKSIAQKNLKEKKTIKAEEAEIADAVNWLRESRAALVTVSRGAKKGDRVEIDFIVKDNGVIIEGGKSVNHPLIIGSGKFVPGFEDKLLDMKAGETMDFQLEMPKNYHYRLGDKKLDFSVTMKLVQERRLPELTDDFAQGLGKFASLEELRKSVRDGLQKEKEEKEKQRLDMLIADIIVAGADLEIPDVLIEAEIGKMFREFEANLQKMNMEFAKYLASINKTEADLKNEWRKDAKKRVAIALCLKEIANKENIEPSVAEVEEYANKSLDVFRADGHNIEKIDKIALRDYSKSILRNQKVFEFLEKQI